MCTHASAHPVFLHSITPLSSATCFLIETPAAASWPIPCLQPSTQPTSPQGQIPLVAPLLPMAASWSPYPTPVAQPQWASALLSIHLCFLAPADTSLHYSGGMRAHPPEFSSKVPSPKKPPRIPPRPHVGRKVRAMPTQEVAEMPGETQASWFGWRGCLHPAQALERSTKFLHILTLQSLPCY